MKKIILVADDSPSIRKFVTFSLAMKGYEIISAVDGMEALEKLPNKQVSLVITDLNMPNLDGFELIKSIRSNEQFKDILLRLNDFECSMAPNSACWDHYMWDNLGKKIESGEKN